MARALVVYVDVDETLVRNYGTSRIPIPRVNRTGPPAQSAECHAVLLEFWRRGLRANQRPSLNILTLGLEDCFVGFLAKPSVYLDDQAFGDWRNLLHVLPAKCGDLSAANLEDQLKLARSTRK